MKTSNKDYIKAILFIVFLLTMIGLTNQVKGQDVFKASTLLNKGNIYMSSYQGTLAEGQITSAQFNLQTSRSYQILKLTYIKGKLISEESLLVETVKEENVYVSLKNTNKKKVSYLIILGYGGKI